MHRRTLMLGILSAGFAWTLGARPARADYTTTPVTSTIAQTETNWNLDFSLPKFNPAEYSLPGQTAVLTQVDLTLNYEFDNTLTMIFAPSLSTITVSASGTMNAYLPDGTTVLSASGPPTGSFSNAALYTLTPSDLLNKDFTKIYDLSPPATGSFVTKLMGQSEINQFLYNSSNGVTMAQLPVTAIAQSSFASSSGNGFGSSVTLAGASISVVYHYVLPEPSSFLLMGLGVMGLGAIAMKRSWGGLKKSTAA